MSEAVSEHEVDHQVEGGAEGADDDRAALEKRARNLGWKPQEEFRSGPPSNWLDADEFVRRGEEELPLVRARNRRLEEMVGGLQKRVDEAVTVVSDLTDRFRTSDQRAYERAFKDLSAKRQEAVANADTEAFQRVETEIQDLQKTAPKTAERAAPAAPAAPPAEVVEWAAENPWFQADPDLNAEAQAIHQALLARRPNLSLKENLAEVAKKIRMANPEKFENTRRNAPAAVSGASAEPPRRANKAPGFDDIPRADQAGYAKAVKMLNGKGKPFTKDEFAKIYWDSQR